MAGVKHLVDLDPGNPEVGPSPRVVECDCTDGLHYADPDREEVDAAFAAAAAREAKALRVLEKAYRRYVRREGLYEAAVADPLGIVECRTTVHSWRGARRIRLVTEAIWKDEALLFAKEARDLAGRLEKVVYG